MFMEPQSEPLDGLNATYDHSNAFTSALQLHSHPELIIIPHEYDQYRYTTEVSMAYCQSCNKPLHKEENDIFIFKGEYAFCSNKCRKLAVNMEEEMEKAQTKAQKLSSAKRLENIGKSPVVFHIRGTASSSTSSSFSNTNNSKQRYISFDKSLS